VGASFGVGLGGVVATGCLGEAPSFSFTSDAEPPSPDGGVDAADVPEGGSSEGGSSFTLTSVSGLVLWVRADKDVRVVGTCAQISSWLDQSGHGNDLSVAAGGAGPTYLSAGGAGGEKVVDFDGTSQFLVQPSALGIASGNGRTLLVVARPKDPGFRAPFLVQTLPSDLAFDSYALEANTSHTQGGFYGLYVAGSGFDTDQATSVTTFGLHVLRVQSIGPSDSFTSKIEYRYNGFRHELTKTGGNGMSSAPPAPTETTLGVFDISGGQRIYGACTITEAAVYDHALSDPELQNVENDIKLRHRL